MGHSFRHFYVQSREEGGQPQIVGHSKDEETDEIYYKFLDKKKAVKLLKDEKKLSPQIEYRIVTEVTTQTHSSWE